MSRKSMILKPISSRERRKRDAIRHNLHRDETLAYRQDRIEDPEKYKYVRLANRSEYYILIAAAVAAYGY